MSEHKTEKKIILKFKCCSIKLWKGEKCKCKEIKNIQKDINDKIKINDINVFTYKNKLNNDSNNKKREHIIVCIINNIIPEQYYKLSSWNILKNNIFLYIKDLCKRFNIINIDNIYCIPKAGRNNHYDFKIIINNKKEFNIEFKYNSSHVADTPQFVSPMKPSQYINMEFESWFYDNYLSKIADFGNLKMPPKNEYYKKIHNNKVECMKDFKEKYDTDKNFNKYCKKIDKEAIDKFIKQTEINIDKLSKYLISSQENKHYMCYSENKINYDTVNKNLYKITKLIKKETTNYIYQTDAGMKLEIKLRFKNGCGIQFPAFQIKRKIPPISKLKEICKANKIKLPIKSLKKDIVYQLDNDNILY